MAEQSDGKASDHEEGGSANAHSGQRDRRARHRVSDDQKSGQGSLSALSKLKMIERKRAQLRITRDDE